MNPATSQNDRVAPELPRPTEESIIDRTRFDAVIVDLDGVVTQTASVHAAAWKRLFDEFLDRGSYAGVEPFTVDVDYPRYVDGKPRYEGVQSFLESRDIELPQGKPDDPPGFDTICALGNRKNQHFLEALMAEPAQVFPDALRALERWRAQGFHLAVVSSSKNCDAILESANIGHFFEERIDGVTSVKLKLAGKPAPDTFLKAAERLAVSPARSVVFEDSLAGVEAGRRGRFGLVVGVDRANHGDQLQENGADVVVQTLDELHDKSERYRVTRQPESLPGPTDAFEYLVFTSRFKRLAIFLDYDGTVTPIVASPDKAVLSDEMRDAVRRLAELCPLAVISGRDREDVKRLVQLDNLYYAGSHGLDIAGPEGAVVKHEVGVEFLPEIDQVESELRERLGDIDGALVERKRFSVAAHYRQVAPAEADLVEQAVTDTLNAHTSIRRTDGKKVYELGPDLDWDKGKAVDYLLQVLDLDRPDVLPVFIGDDRTDENAFSAIRERGVSLLVGSHGAETLANYHLEDVDAVRTLLEALISTLGRRQESDFWTLRYDDWDPDAQSVRESLCTLGNGYFCTRGAWEEVHAGDAHYPGTYLAGGYNRLKSEVAGRVVENEDLVNWPNWLCLTFRPEGGDWFHPDTVTFECFCQELDMANGTLERRIRFRDADGRRTSLTSKRMVHMENPHLAMIEWSLIPENWSGAIEVRTALDGTVRNDGVARYRDLSSQHLEPLDNGETDDGVIYQIVQTNQSGIRMALAARTRAPADGPAPDTETTCTKQAGYIEQVLTTSCRERVCLRIEKAVAIYTSRDRAIGDPHEAALRAVREAGSYAELLRTHRAAWDTIWHRCDLNLADGVRAQRILRLHVFHILQTVSRNTIDLDAGLPARGWHGEAYRGHVFWDELFIFPFLNLRLPELTRALLMYRYRRLPEARRAALEAGHAGALYPWQSGSDGREESQRIHLNPRSGRWIPDDTHLQYHVNSGLAYNIWQYFQVSQDLDFLYYYGAEMFLEIARFWASIATFNESRDRYEINGVVGPDEYHTRYPDSDEPGLRNNAYTNVTAVWVLAKAPYILETLSTERQDELRTRLFLTDDELNRWDDISKRMYVPFHDGSIISQFEGYEALEEFDWPRYREQYGNVLRLDRILEAENDSPNRYKAAKQADVLMLFYLLSAEELTNLFDRMGYDFDPKTIPENVDYYLERTSHGSTLSTVAHSWVLARSDRAAAWDYFTEALESDVSDVQGGTTGEGIHLGAMAGTVDLVQRCFTGVELRDDVLLLNPCLPERMSGLTMRIRYRNHWFRLQVSQQRLSVKLETAWAEEVEIGFGGEVYSFEEGQDRVFSLMDQSCET